MRVQKRVQIDISNAVPVREHERRGLDQSRNFFEASARLGVESRVDAGDLPILRGRPVIFYCVRRLAVRMGKIIRV